MTFSKRPRVTRLDLLFALAGLAGGLLLIAAHGYARWTPLWDPAQVWRTIPLLGLVAATPFRRTAPRGALLFATPFNFADVAMGPGFATAVIYGDLLYAAALYGRRRTAEWLAGTTIVGSLAVGGLLLTVWHSVAGAVVGVAIAGVTWLFPVMSAMVVRGHRRTAQAERQRAEQVARLAELDRRGAINAERARMARELHDVVANHLSAVALHSSAILKVPDLDRDGINQAMEVIRENSVQGLAEMRRMISLLREEEGTEPDSLAAPRLDGLERLVGRCVRADLTAELEVRGDPPELPAAVELAAYRIVQESLTNALKHGGAGRVRVGVRYLRDRVAIEVRSPLGEDGSRLPGSGAGLIGMRERAAMLDGTFAAGPDGGAWRVRAELPVAPAGTERENA
ncbi:histidine kinase [Actinomadura viridis]|uniref:histidine kinase n=1 Tax=Actinomadura viridis TaxID=58110 RepID=A0A931DFD0_9ACTN|nr:sensor histidine kinase [Actinomadura viridis]MBG6090104.1 signal transduction histidine kinase [Actinomadura viridis]